MRHLYIKVVAAPLILFGMGIPIAAWAQERPYEYWGMHYMWGPWGIGMMLMMLVFLGLVIAALVLAGQPGEGIPLRFGGRDTAPAVRARRAHQGRVRGEEARDQLMPYRD